MDNEETMVEMDDFQADDTPDGEIIEETDESEESLESLTEEEDEGGQAEEQPKSQGTSEPGYVQRRIEKAVAKALAAERENIRAEYEQRFAPLQERLIEMDARELVQQGVVKDLETAKELVRYRQGQTASPQAPAEQPRNSNGQFAPKEDPVMNAQIDMLAHQADTIRDEYGIDVIKVFSENPDIKQKVISGEMDFYDVARMMQKQQGGSRKKAPAPMRSPNGAAAHSPNAIENMTDEQFRRMEEKISKGARYALK